MKDPENIVLLKRRLEYRASHRGTREMDFLLGRFACARLDVMTPPEIEVFAKLLEEPDPRVYDWIMTDAVADEKFAGLITEIREFHRV